LANFFGEHNPPPLPPPYQRHNIILLGFLVVKCVRVEKVTVAECDNVQFKAHILSIDRGDDGSNNVEPTNDGDVEPADEEQAAAGENSVF